ncbi:hypothetical protein ACIQVE_07085 [Pseudomonas sp. NPDC098747]|uniref:hypothetical protein n=1 Tax=Pseudomonas sp. NPDC098747 TaxID=3364487 RepID=UPI00383AB7E3
MKPVVVQDHTAKVLEAIEALTKQQVLIGIPSSKAERKEGEPINNAQLGYIHEFGAPAANIPARPFLIPGVELGKESIENHMKKAAKAALSSDKAKVENELHAAGLVGQAGARYQINSGDHAPLAEGTLSARRKRGRTGEKPLIDTGQLRNSITYVVRKKV